MATGCVEKQINPRYCAHLCCTCEKPIDLSTEDWCCMSSFIRTFGHGPTQSDEPDRSLLGGKGAMLCAMSTRDFPVPPGFVITTDISKRFNETKRLPEDFAETVRFNINSLADALNRTFGGNKNPLFISVRSGAPVSMPGMMDTVLNIGLNDETAEALARETGDAFFAYETYRQFVKSYATVVLDLPAELFEEQTSGNADGVSDVNTLKQQLEQFKNTVEAHEDEPFPQDPWKQVTGAITAVLRSWNSPRALAYRAMNDIDADHGTAVIIQAMVFGNRDERSATGVAFTRNPSTGEKGLFGEYLLKAQGEVIVSGTQTPNPLTRATATIANQNKPTLQQTDRKIFSQLENMANSLEEHFKDMQDIEFTVEQGKLWILQTRSGKRTVAADIRIAVEMADEGLITTEEAVRRIDPASLVQLLHPTLDPDLDQPIIVNGLPASPGAAAGEVVFTSEDAEQLTSENRQAILVRAETSPEDIRGMHAATGILTARGGMTSHAAVVARGMGKPCIVGATRIRIDLENQLMMMPGRTVRRGDVITLDGTTGNVYSGHVRQIEAEMSGYFATLMSWADEIGGQQVRANADTPADAATAKEFGAGGIGLCRSERMFVEQNRVNDLREMILARSPQRRQDALQRLVAGQREDLIEIFEIMAGLPVAIRLLDPPFHEFMPSEHGDIENLANALEFEVSELEHRMVLINEVNPMMGNRGCRMLISHPEIVEMQTRAILEAADKVNKDTGLKVLPEIMIPVVGMRREQKFVRDRIDRTASRLGLDVQYRVGTIIELPRAALIADQIAETADFLTFGTNDLTQTTFGISRDDASKYWRSYEEHALLGSDPFVTIDQDGVGELMKITIERGKDSKPGLEIGICGEQGGDPTSVEFCHAIGVDYVSCSPYRVPIARLAAAQAELAHA